MTANELHQVLRRRFAGLDIEYTRGNYAGDDTVYERQFVVVQEGKDEFTPSHCVGEFVAFVSDSNQVEVIRI